VFEVLVNFIVEVFALIVGEPEICHDDDEAPVISHVPEPIVIVLTVEPVEEKLLPFTLKLFALNVPSDTTKPLLQLRSLAKVIVPLGAVTCTVDRINTPAESSE
jgi:hypothetical protein